MSGKNCTMQEEGINRRVPIQSYSYLFQKLICWQLKLLQKAGNVRVVILIFSKLNDIVILVIVTAIGRN